MNRLVLLTILVVLSLSDQLIPVNKNGYGFSIGDPNGPDSKTSYNVWKQVQRTISLYQKNVKLTFQIIPLQFHYYAFKLHTAFFYVAKVGGQSAAVKLMDFFFNNQEQFTQQVLMNYTLDNFLNQLSAIISSLTKLDQTVVRNQLNSGSQSDKTARYHWKYSVGTHGISGAPIFNVNGVRLDGAEDYGSSEWVQFIKNNT